MRHSHRGVWATRLVRIVEMAGLEGSPNPVPFRYPFLPTQQMAAVVGPDGGPGEVARSDETNGREGLKTARFLMVLSSISPLFILWGIRGNRLVPDKYFIGICAVMVIAPNLFLWLRFTTARRLKEKRTIRVGKADDHRTHVLVYLFAVLLPFYRQDPGSWRDLGAAAVAVAFIVFLFFHLNLHYMNILFALLGYRVFSVNPPSEGNAVSGKTSVALITRRVSLSPGEDDDAYRLSDTVYVEVSE